MDEEDEPNSYLKYLNDSEAPNSYLLESNGLFAPEPIFTMGSNWQQETFPLLLSNGLITEEDANTATELSGKLTETALPSTSDELAGSVPLTESIDTFLPKDKIPIITDQDKNKFFGNDLPIIERQSILEEPSESPLCNNEMIIDDVLSANGENIDNAEEEAAKANNDLIFIKTKEPSSKIIKLFDLDGTPISIDDAPVTSPANNEPKSIDDLFSTVIANKCNICAYLCEDMEEIKTHVSTNHPDECQPIIRKKGISLLIPQISELPEEKKVSKKQYTIFVCSECHAVCTSKKNLKEHMIFVHSLVKKKEGNTVVSNSVDSELDKSTRKVETKQVYMDDVNIGLVKKQERLMQQVRCSVKGCVAKFPNELAMKKHEKLHVVGTRSMFKCSECDEQFGMWSITRGHMHQKHNVDFGMLICPICHLFKSYTTVRMLRHMMIHEEIKPYLCSSCGKSFSQLAQLKNHEVQHKDPEDLPKWTRVKKCEICQSFLANSKALKMHMKTVHEKIKPFICNICGHKSSRKAMLELHMRQHSASKPYKCDTCNFQTRDKSSLRKHLLRHSEDKPYQCPHCSFSCIQAKSIKHHYLRKHKDKNLVYFCQYCSYSTINENSLSLHERLHEVTMKEKNEDDSKHVAGIVDDQSSQTDEETQSCFLNAESHNNEETVDNGGFTIPAGLDIHQG